MNAGRRDAAGPRRRAIALAAVAGLSLGLVPVARAAPSAGIVAGILPVAVNDTSTVVHGRTRTVAAPGVLANDLQVGGGFTARLVTGPSYGSLDLAADGGYTYTADLTFVGEDTFRYRVDGGLLGVSNIATVRIAVTNAAPVARSDSYAAVAGVQRSVATPGILGNDDDGDGDALTIDLVQQPAGALVLGADGRLRYTADAGFAGVDTFTYRVTDGAAWSSTVEVRMTVSAPAATATPTPRPSADPTASPTAKPTATPTPRPTATPGRTPAPTGAATPTPQVSSVPSRPPTATPSGAPVVPPRPTGRPSPTASPTASTASSPWPARAGEGTPAPSQAGGGPTGPGTPGGPTSGGAMDVGAVPGGSGFDFGTVGMAFDGFEWAVPGLVLTVPGLLLMLAVGLQSVTAIGWLRVTRRWLGSDRSRRDDPQR